jgi:hypothetical protein
MHFYIRLHPVCVIYVCIYMADLSTLFHNDRLRAIHVRYNNKQAEEGRFAMFASWFISRLKRRINICLHIAVLTSVKKALSIKTINSNTIIMIKTALISFECCNRFSCHYGRI